MTVLLTQYHKHFDFILVVLASLPALFAPSLSTITIFIVNTIIIIRTKIKTNYQNEIIFPICQVDKDFNDGYINLCNHKRERYEQMIFE